MLPASTALLDTESNHWQQPIMQHNRANQGTAATAGKNTQFLRAPKTAAHGTQAKLLAV